MSRSPKQFRENLSEIFLYFSSFVTFAGVAGLYFAQKKGYLKYEHVVEYRRKLLPFPQDTRVSYTPKETDTTSTPLSIRSKSNNTTDS